MTTRAEDAPATLGLLAQMKTFRAPFWAANVMELFERLAYYGVRVVIPIYIASSEDPGGLHFTNAEKGTILTVWALVQTLLPMFTGGYADKYGRKSTIAVSIGIKMAGYLLMATARSFWGFFFACQVLATGTAIFKPGVQGTLVRGTTKESSSVGWGIFYQLVNIGGWLGPPLAGFLHHFAWRWVFISCAAIVSINFITLMLYKDDDDSAVKDGDDATAAKSTSMKDKSGLQVLVYSLRTLFRPRLLAFILITAGFWVMFMQLYDALPNFIEEWTDSRDIVSTLNLHEGMFAAATPRGLQVPQEWMINLDATAIVFLMLPIAWVSGRVKRLRSILAGTIVASAGLLVCGVATSGWICLGAIFVFAIGEMLAVPKMSEYLGVVAPKGQEALYMGYSNVPYAIGWTSGAYVAGWYYDRVSDKANLSRRFLVEHAGYTADAAHAIDRTKVFAEMMRATGLDATSATHTLWDAYRPYEFWYPFVVAGLVSAVGMFFYARAARRWTTENA